MKTKSAKVKNNLEFKKVCEAHILFFHLVLYLCESICRISDVKGNLRSNCQISTSIQGKKSYRIIYLI